LANTIIIALFRTPLAEMLRWFAAILKPLLKFLNFEGLLAGLPASDNQHLESARKEEVTNTEHAEKRPCISIQGLVGRTLEHLKNSDINGKIATFFSENRGFKVEANTNIADALKQDREQTLRLLTMAVQRCVAETLEETVQELEESSSTAMAIHEEAAANNKFTLDFKTMSAGDIEHFHMGLDEFNGRPVGDNIETQMKLEFDEMHSWTAHNSGHKIETDLRTEWEFVVKPDKHKIYPGMEGAEHSNGSADGPSTESRAYRVVRELKEFMELELTCVLSPSALTLCPRSSI
jgi:hypothetical protein